MAHKTFISYKYNESRGLRDRILSSLGSDFQYYQGETSESPDLTDTTTENIKRNLRDMIYGTTVTIVIISPHIKESKCIDWEIEYSLKQTTRGDRRSSINGIVGVVMEVNRSYDWFITHAYNCHGNPVVSYKQDFLYPIIYENHFNSTPPFWHCQLCKTYEYLLGSYIEYVPENEFLLNPEKYISNAYDKSENTNRYILRRLR